MEEEDEAGYVDITPRSAMGMIVKAVLGFWVDDYLIGGAIISQGGDGGNFLDRFFVALEKQGQGFGHLAWGEIEKAYPNTNGWQLRTPTCLINNVCFYVNKCGFSIVKVEDMKSDGVGMYVFQKK